MLTANRISSSFFPLSMSFVQKKTESCPPWDQPTQTTTRWFWKRFAFGDSSLWLHDLGFLEWNFVFFLWTTWNKHIRRQQTRIALMYVDSITFSDEWMLELLASNCFFPLRKIQLVHPNVSKCNFSLLLVRFLPPPKKSQIEGNSVEFIMSSSHPSISI